MADNEATIRFILQDEGGDAAPGGEGVADPSGVNRPRTTEARATAAGERAETAIGDRSESVAKREDTAETVEKQETKREGKQPKPQPKERQKPDPKLKTEPIIKAKLVPPELAKVVPDVSPEIINHAAQAATAAKAFGPAGAAISQALAAGTSVAAAAGPVGIAVAATAVVAGSGVIAVNAAREASLSRAKAVGGLSPDVAREQALAEVRELQGRLRSARRGEIFADQVRGESRLSVATQGLSEDILAPTLRDLAQTTNDIATIVEGMRDVSEKNAPFIELGTNILKRMSGVAGIEDAIAGLAKLVGGENALQLGSPFGALTHEIHLQPSTDQWPANSDAVISGKFPNAPPGAGAAPGFLRRAGVN